MQKEHQKIHEKLNKYLENDKIANFLFESTNVTEDNFGRTGEELGGAYDPLTFSEEFGGSVLVEWPNGKISKTDVSPKWIEDFDQEMSVLKKMMYKDDADKNFLDSADCGKFTKQKSEEIIKRDFNPETELVERVAELQQWMSDLKETSQYSFITVAKSRITITNSKGLLIEEDKTYIGESAYLGEFTGFSLNGRSIKDFAKEEAHRKRTGKIYKAMQTDLQGSKHSKLTDAEVILSPYVFASLFDHFIVTNLKASSIYYKQSAFTKKDFSDNKKIAPPKLSLRLFPRTEMNYYARNYSDIGWVYPDEYEFIKDGRLVSPIANHRFANLIDVEPTPSISSLRLAEFGDIEKSMDYEEQISNVNEGIVITTMLGLHTQDANTGDFSLVCPKSIIVRDSKMQGVSEFIIRGNFFDLIRDINSIYRDTLTNLPFVSDASIEYKET
jgi:PmbA protein